MSTSASSSVHRRTPVTSLPADALASLKAGHGLLRIGDVMALIGLRSRTSLYKLVQTGDLPQPVKLRPGGRASAWRAADVAAFIESREVDPLARPVKQAAADDRCGTPAPPKPVKRAPRRNRGVR